MPAVDRPCRRLLLLAVVGAAGGYLLGLGAATVAVATLEPSVGVTLSAGLVQAVATVSGVVAAGVISGHSVRQWSWRIALLLLVGTASYALLVAMLGPGRWRRRCMPSSWWVRRRS